MIIQRRACCSIITIMGHSLGGYFSLFTLLTELKMNSSYFSNYVAASPSLDYHNQYLLKQFQNEIDSGTKSRALFLTLGAKEDHEDGGTGTENADNFNALMNELSESKFNNIKSQKIIYSNLEHMQTAIPTFTQFIQEIK